MNRRDERRALNTMRNCLAAGITDQGALVDTAATVLGGSEDAKMTAQLVYDKFMAIKDAV